MGGLAEVCVKRFRQVLIWPLAVARPRDKTSEWTPRGEVDRQACLLSAAECTSWREVEDGLEHLDGSDTEKFQEFVYFHDFVARFLFARTSVKETNKRALRIFRRDDVNSVSVKLPGEEGSLDLTVERVRLYLFDVGVAVLVAEVSASDLDLSEVMNLSNRFRRSYPPWWEMEGAPGDFPEQVSWRNGNGKELFGLKKRGWQKEDYTNHVVDTHRHAPVAPHWRALIEPLAIEGHDERIDGRSIGNESEPPRWRHVVDERIPVMTYIGTPDIAEISRGDWIRLCFVDTPGADLPYATSSLADFEREHAYDRFWEPGRGLKTRYLFAGYAMVMATSNDDFAKAHLETHFRRHYFQMGLIVHLQVSALLALSDQISMAVADYESNREGGLGDFEDRIAALHDELLRFTLRYWFTGVSNQMQARELYDLWRERLGVQALHEEVANEAREADQFLTLKRQDRIADDNKRLTEFAAVGLPVALAIGFLGMNLIVGRPDGLDFWIIRTDWQQVLLVLTVFALLGAVLTAVLYRDKADSRGRRGFVRWPKPVFMLLIVAGLSSLILLGLALWCC